MPTPQRRAVIITALPIERTAVLEHLRDVAEEPPLRGSIYRRGIFDERSDPWDIIVAEIGAGNEGAAAEAERVLAHYTPDVAVFIGVAGRKGPFAGRRGRVHEGVQLRVWEGPRR